MRGATAAVVAALVIACGAPFEAAQAVVSGAVPAPVSLQSLLPRCAAYVRQFERDLGSVVSEELYTQDIRPSAGIGQRQAGGGTVLRSDFLLVQVEGQGWLPFRDVFERDGKPLRDRQDRLTELFLSNSRGAFDQARKIMAESARYNIGNVERNVNVPTLPLQFLLPESRDRFAFSDGKADPDLPGRVIDFKETGRPTFISTTGGRDLPVYGRFWVDEQAGTVMRTELHMVDTALEGHVTVVYEVDAVTGLRVPVRMEERYRRQKDSSELRGVATYSKFRKFQVSTSEEVAP
jgi:hypothetical protein